MKRTTGQDRSKTRNWRPATRAIRGGTWRSEMGETSEALFLTSGYSYDDAATVAATARICAAHAHCATVANVLEQCALDTTQGAARQGGERRGANGRARLGFNQWNSIYKRKYRRDVCLIR